MIVSKLGLLEQDSIKRKIPILGKEKGIWLYGKVKELQPKRILELGTANGYSGIILGSEGSELTTIELDEKIAEEAMINFANFNVNAKILIGDGVKIVNELASVEKNHHSFDLIFIDFAKKRYIEILESCLKLTKQNGAIIADNITMGGCQDYKKAVLNDSRLKTEIVDIKDGLSCSEKI